MTFGILKGNFNLSLELCLLAALLTLHSCQGQYTRGCDYYQSVQVGKSYDVFSPGYPNNYKASTRCRWTADVPTGYIAQLTCSDFQLPTSANCQNDRVEVSTRGDSNLTDAASYCGTGKFSTQSTKSRIVIALIVPSRTNGGKFLCTLSAIKPPVKSCECGISQKTRIVGGMETGIHEFPSMAGIVDLNIRSMKCGAIIISTWYSITAAHCFPGGASKYALLTGEHDYGSGSETAVTQLYMIDKITVHPKYLATPTDNDIAIVRTSKEILFIPLKVSAACLPFRFAGDDMAGEVVKAVGWGSTSFGGPVSNKLMKVDLNVVTRQKCQQYYDNGTITDQQICTFAVGKDACQNDSGGPLYYISGGRQYVVGIISYGLFCAIDAASVNTRVSMFLDWIRASTPLSPDYCISYT